MKVLLINGSPHLKGNTYYALGEAAKTLNDCGINTEIFHIGSKPVQGCMACYKCKTTGECIFKDEVYLSLRAKLQDADAIIIGSPVYFAGPAGSLCALLDRVMYSCSQFLRNKPAACVVVCRRGGASSAFDRLNKYFTILNMPVVSSQYWNMVYGREPGEVLQDKEGMQTMRTLGRNMAYMLKSFKQAALPHPEQEPITSFNFIH